MGFGTLFVGYILTYLFVLTPFGYLFELVGSALMLYAMTKLTEYNKNFRYSFFAAIPVVLIALFSSVINSVDMLGVTFIPPEMLILVVAYAKAVFNLLFHIALLTAVADIARETGCGKIRTAAYRNLIIYAFYFVLFIVSNLSVIQANETAYSLIALAGNIFWLAWVILNGTMLYSCYMRICDENDTEMKAKTSRFSFINKFREEFDRRENKAREADRRFYKEKKTKKEKKKK
ncbi:MAG: hypothetical protein E7640_02855 [Ruminococcaceae bacterium]|nr:hypothetical protein [Oscillospiraceae bacterium]